MKKLSLCLIIALLVSTGLFADGVPPLGSGTEAEPYLIGTVGNLQWVSENFASWDKYFEQTGDINASGLAWNPIGNWSHNFTGSYDGQNHTIDNLNYYSGQDSKGVFGVAVSAVIKNLGITNVVISGYQKVGGLVGYASGTEIINCYSTGNVNPSNNIGGGLVGENISSTITNCYASVTVSGNWYTPDLGGLVGKNENSTINNCYSTGSVSGQSGIGGLVGYNFSSSQINNSYSTVSVNCGNNSGGGLVGNNSSSSQINNCYSTGAVSGSSSNISGFVGVNNATVSNSFWDTQTSGKSTGIGGGTTTGATGKTTADMKNVATFTATATVGLTTAWDFVGNPYDDVANNDYWNIDGTNNNGYPFLSWRYPSYIPTNVIITIVGNNVQLNWDDMGVAGYSIYRSTEPYPQDWGVTIGTSTTNSYTDIDASVSSKNFYRITGDLPSNQ